MFDRGGGGELHKEIIWGMYVMFRGISGVYG